MKTTFRINNNFDCESTGKWQLTWMDNGRMNVVAEVEDDKSSALLYIWLIWLFADYFQ